MATIPAPAGLAGPWFRVLSIPPARAPASAGQDFASVLPAALSAARRGVPFAAGWLSRGGGAPLELVTNAGPAAPGESPDGPRDLLFPGGARGVPAASDWPAVLGRLVWGTCPARHAPALPGGGQESQPDGREPTIFESALVTLMAKPFGWLVVAEPAAGIDAEITRLRTTLTVARRHEEERSRFDAERAQRWLAELDLFREGGLWRVRVLAGAATAGDLGLLAPVLAGSVSLGQHGYRLRGPEGARPLPAALAAAVADSGDGAEAPFTATAGPLAALTGLPRAEVPGVRVREPGHFDLTSEAGAGAGEPAAAVELGAILDGQDRPVGTLRVPLPTLNRHVFVTGATGSGKSQTVRHLLEQLTRAGLPWLAIEPVKSEYAGLAGRLAGTGEAGRVTVINPADPSAVPLSVNPLAPEPGYPVQAHIDMVRALFLAAFDAQEPFPQIMSQALQLVYEAAGWDVVTGGGLPGAAAPPAVPALGQLQQAALDVIEDVGYGRQLAADVRGFVQVRLRSLRVGSAGRFFEGGHPADIGALLRRNVVLAIEDVANDEDKAFLIGTLIIRIVEHLRLRARGGAAAGLRHVIVIEEAHRLLRARGEDRASAHAVELFASMLAEIRAYGEGIVVAEQIPGKLVPDVVKNTALKVVHRLPARDDRDLVGAAMNLDPAQSRQVVSLAPGVAAVFADGMDRPLRIQVPFGGPREGTRPGPLPPLAGRRSAACGPCCTGERPCTLLELRQADLLAAGAGPDPGWLRLWAETLVLALLTNRGLPAVPPALRRHWAQLPPRLRECLLGHVIDRVTGARAAAVREAFPPRQLTASAAALARRLLDQGAGAGTRAGPGWVIPQLRWLHEFERVSPLAGQAPAPGDRVQPLDFDLPGLADWPGMLAGQRARALCAHPLSMELPHNQLPAWQAILGDDDQQAFARDLAAATVGLPPAGQLRAAAQAMAVTAWLDVVLSWPRRFIAADQERTAALAAARPPGRAPAAARDGG
ncbi:MAG: ATP-binding protein [Gemmatimonadota bacterium]